MATVGIVNGHNLRWYLDGVAIAKATECTISMSTALRETTHKDVGGPTGWAANESGVLSWEGQCTALFAEAESFETLWTAFSTAVQVDIVFSTDESGDKTFEGSAIITSLEMNAPDNENVSYSVSFTGNGPLVRDTVAGGS